MAHIPARIMSTHNQAADQPVAHRRRTQRPAVLLAAPLLSLLLPGLGQFALGKRRRGLAMITAMASLWLMLLAVAPRNPIELLASVVRPNFLVAVMLANVALFGFRLFAMLDAFRLARNMAPRQTRRSIVVVVLLIGFALAAVPHVALGYYDLVTYRAIDQIFVQETPAHPRDTVPTAIELTRPVQLAPGVTAAAPPTSLPEKEIDP